ncbi:MAG: hypothetical protein ACPHX8_01830 [Candidatus Poseidoniaceae archaeon]
MAIRLNPTIKRLRLGYPLKIKFQLKFLNFNWNILNKFKICFSAERGKIHNQSYPRLSKSQNAVGIFKEVDKSPYGGRVSGKFLNGMQLSRGLSNHAGQCFFWSL